MSDFAQCAAPMPTASSARAPARPNIIVFIRTESMSPGMIGNTM